MFHKKTLHVLKIYMYSKKHVVFELHTTAHLLEIFTVYFYLFSDKLQHLGVLIVSTANGTSIHYTL